MRPFRDSIRHFPSLGPMVHLLGKQRRLNEPVRREDVREEEGRVR